MTSVPLYLDKIHRVLVQIERTSGWRTDRPWISVVVTGSRVRWADLQPWVPVVARSLNLIRARVAPRPLRVAQGGAYGIDDVALRWTRHWHQLDPERVLEPVTYPVSDHEWNSIGRAAGMERNKVMLTSENPDIVLGYPVAAPSTGTNGCLKEAVKRHFPIVRITPSDVSTWIDIAVSTSV